MRLTYPYHRSLSTSNAGGYLSIRLGKRGWVTRVTYVLLYVCFSSFFFT
jgi:hypothetical protein